MYLGHPNNQYNTIDLVESYGDRNSTRLNPYHRLDIGLTHHKQKEKGPQLHQHETERDRPIQRRPQAARDEPLEAPAKGFEALERRCDRVQGSPEEARAQGGRRCPRRLVHHHGAD